ncbi:hypothetical protein GF326_04960 [Candidatus Bathyarchaeota archaeon]|nr:hypothetical protein [Candidatus Bathyarchaeota archaeon]
MFSRHIGRSVVSFTVSNTIQVRHLRAQQKLTEAHIISNKMPLPEDHWDQKSGIRIGVTEVTRRGMQEPEMKQIASIIGDILVEGKSPADVAGEVVSLMSVFQEVKYTL